MKPVNLLLCCLILSIFVSSCEKDSEITDENEIGDFGLQKGECIAVASYLNGKLLYETTYNSSNNRIIRQLYSGGEKNISVHFERISLGYIKGFEVYLNGELIAFAENEYNEKGFLKLKTYINETDGSIRTTDYTYNNNVCSLASICINERFCTEYDFIDDGKCSYNHSDADYELETTYKDGMKHPWQAILPNIGFSRSNVLRYELFYPTINKYSNIKEYRNYKYNEYGYPTSYEIFNGVYPDFKTFEFQDRYTFRYYCFE